MPSAARVTDLSNHGGSVVGPGVPTVMVGGLPAAVLGDLHVCALPPPGHAPTASPFTLGSASYAAIYLEAERDCTLDVFVF